MERMWVFPTADLAVKYSGVNCCPKRGGHAVGGGHETPPTYGPHPSRRTHCVPECPGPDSCTCHTRCTKCAPHPASRPALGTKRAPRPALGTKRAPHPALGTKRAPRPALGTKRAPRPALGTKRAPLPALGEMGAGRSRETLQQ